MKQRAPLILGIAACVLSALCLWQVLEVKSQLTFLDARQDEELSIIEDAIQTIPGRIDASLTTQNSLLVDYDCQYGKTDLDTWTLPLTFTVTPKEQTPGVTTAALVLGGKNYPMEAQEDGSFSANLELPLLQEISLPRVAFSGDGRQRMQVLDIHIVPGEEDLPLFTSNLYYEASYEDGTVCLRRLNLDMELTTCIPAWTTMSLVAKTDGKELGRQPVTPPVEDGDEWVGFSQTLGDITYPVAQGKTLSLSLEATDPQGLRYVAPLVELTLSKSDIFPAGRDQLTSDTIEIYSPQGKLLWSGSPYLY